MAKPKSARRLAYIGKTNVVHARRHVGKAWRLIAEMQTVSTRLKRMRPLGLSSR